MRRASPHPPELAYRPRLLPGPSLPPQSARQDQNGQVHKRVPQAVAIELRTTSHEAQHLKRGLCEARPLT